MLKAFVIGTENGVQKLHDEVAGGMVAAIAYIDSKAYELRMIGYAVAWDHDRHGWRASNGETLITLRAYEAIEAAQS